MQKAATGQGVAQSGAIDLAHLERATFGDRGLARDVLRIFERQCETLLRDIARATDSAGRAYAAHTLKGAARGVGAFPVAEAAEAIELRPNEMTAGITRLAAEIDKTRAVMAEIMARD